jgi:hypothetical protein
MAVEERSPFVGAALPLVPTDPLLNLVMPLA